VFQFLPYLSIVTANTYVWFLFILSGSRFKVQGSRLIT